jgi:hypothetical protein
MLDGMDSEKFLLVIKLRQVHKYLTVKDIKELSLSNKSIYNQINPSLISNFIIKSQYYKKFYENESEMKKFELETNNYLGKNFNLIKNVTVSLAPSFCKVNLNWEILTKLTSVSLIGRVKLEEINNLLKFSNCLVKLKLSKIEVAVKMCNEKVSNHIQLPATLVELNIYNLIWAVVAFNRIHILKYRELGVYIFGKNVDLSRLRSLTWFQPSRGPKALIKFLISKAPNITELKGNGEVFNNAAYDLLNSGCISLNSLSLIFNDDLPVTSETLTAYKFSAESDLTMLYRSICSNSLRLYLICKSCPYLEDLTIYCNNIDIVHLNRLLPLLPQIKKLTLINHFKGIDIKKLNFSNSTINHLTLSKFFFISLSQITENLRNWTLLKRISIESSGGGSIVDDGVKAKLESGSRPWRCFAHKGSIQLWLK